MQTLVVVVDILLFMMLWMLLACLAVEALVCAKSYGFRFRTDEDTKKYNKHIIESAHAWRIILMFVAALFVITAIMAAARILLSSVDNSMHAIALTGAWGIFILITLTTYVHFRREASSIQRLQTWQASLSPNNSDTPPHDS